MAFRAPMQREWWTSIQFILIMFYSQIYPDAFMCVVCLPVTSAVEELNLTSLAGDRVTLPCQSLLNNSDVDWRHQDTPTSPRLLRLHQWRGLWYISAEIQRWPPTRPGEIWSCNIPGTIVRRRALYLHWWCGPGQTTIYLPVLCSLWYEYLYTYRPTLSSVSTV